MENANTIIKQEYEDDEMATNSQFSQMPTTSSTSNDENKPADRNGAKLFLNGM